MTNEIIAKNPCRIPGFDTWDVAERPTATVDQVDALAAAMPPRFRAFVMTAAYVGLRWSELTNLRRADLDLSAGKLRVVASKKRGRYPHRRPAGHVVNALSAHVAEFVNDDPAALVFTGAKGGRITSANWQRAVRWSELLRSVGLPVGFHFHDLRHTSNNLAAATGASTRELMHRMGALDDACGADLPTREQRT